MKVFCKRISNYMYGRVSWNSVGGTRPGSGKAGRQAYRENPLDILDLGLPLTRMAAATLGCQPPSR